MAVDSTSLAAAEARIPTLEASYRADKSAFIGTVRRGIYSGAGVNEARALASSLAGSLSPMATAGDAALQQRLLARIRSICT